MSPEERDALQLLAREAMDGFTGKTPALQDRILAAIVAACPDPFAASAAEAIVQRRIAGEKQLELFRQLNNTPTGDGKGDGR